MATVISGNTGIDKVTDGAAMPAGSVLQMVQSNVLLKTGTWTDNNNHLVCSVSITPKSPTSKMFITGQIVSQFYGNDNTSNMHWSLRVAKDSSNILEALGHDNTVNGHTARHKTPTHIISGINDSGNTNTRVYQIYLQKTESNNNGRLNLNSTHGTTNIKVTEVEV